jgi:CheY-like chemotaxis protein
MAVILVVEDDVFIREMAESIIFDWGHQILSACDVPEASFTSAPRTTSTPYSWT